MPAKRARTLGAHSPASTVGAVDVQPQVPLAAHRGEARQVVDQPEVGGPRGRDHREHVVGAVERRPSASPVRRRRPSTGTDSTSTSITRAAERTEEWTSSLRRRATARVGAPCARARSRAACSADRLPFVPPWTKTAAGLLRQAGEPGQPRQRLVLRVHGARALEP